MNGKSTLVLAMLLVASVGQAQQSKEGYMSFNNFIGFQKGSCGGNAMYYTSKQIARLNPATQGNSTTDSVVTSYKDRFSYWGMRFFGERFTEGGYVNYDFSGLADVIVLGIGQLAKGSPVITGKHKNYAENNKGNLSGKDMGGIYSDIFGLVGAYGTKIKDGLYWKVGGHYKWGLQQSVNDIGNNAKLLNRTGYAHTYGFNVHINLQQKGSFPFVLRNTLFLNWHASKKDALGSKGSGFKLESMCYTKYSAGIGLYFQYTNMKAAYADATIFGSGVANLPQARFTNLGIVATWYLRNNSNKF